MVFVRDDDNQANIKIVEIQDAKQVVENIEQKLVDISYVHDTIDANIDIVNPSKVVDGNRKLLSNVFKEDHTFKMVVKDHRRLVKGKEKIDYANKIDPNNHEQKNDKVVVQKEVENSFDDIYHIKIKEVVNLNIISKVEGIDDDDSNIMDSVKDIKIGILKGG